RAAARTSIRLPTLTQAIRRRSATAAVSATTVGRRSPTSTCENDGASLLGSCMLALMTSDEPFLNARSSAAAAVGVAPGVSRPTTVISGVYSGDNATQQSVSAG